MHFDRIELLGLYRSYLSDEQSSRFKNRKLAELTMRQVLLPIIRPDGVMDGGFVVGKPTDFSEEPSPYTLVSGHSIDIERHESPSYGVVFYVAKPTLSQATSREYSTWEEYAPNSILNKDSLKWIGGGSGSAQNKAPYDTSLMSELLKGTVYTATSIPVPTVPPSPLEGNDMDMPPYGTPQYWSTGNLMPPELIVPPGSDPSNISVKDITDFEFVHHQLTPSATWVVTHGLGRYPALVVLDPDGNGLGVQVDYVSKDILHLIFIHDQIGTCRCV